MKVFLSYLPRVKYQYMTLKRRLYHIFPHNEATIKYWNKLAIKDSNGAYNYGHIYTKSYQLLSLLQNIIDNSRKQQNIALLLPNDVSYVIAQWTIFALGHTVVPLHPAHPTQQKNYYMNDSAASLVITNEEYSEQMKPFLSGQQVVVLEQKFITSVEKDDVVRKYKQLCEASYKNEHEDGSDSAALIIYTSGTTGPPKGVVLTHRNLRSQIQCIVKAWKISSCDVLLHCLPLNHVHGVINALMCPLYCGASVVMKPHFEANAIWSQLLHLNTPAASRTNLFMGVPTIYAKLIEEYDAKLSGTSQMRQYIKNVCLDNIRLMVSGSASLPTVIHEKWQTITGLKLLERYGMTEIGMALTNPLKGNRKPGFVGQPFPGVQVRIVKFPLKGDTYDVLCEGNEHETKVTPGCENESGELLVKGPNVFSHYWNREETTKKEFTPDGWFRTGDTVAYIDGNYKILGRTSVDIIKTGGFKVSALDIERHLLTHPEIVDAAVVGLPDITWGEKVAAAIVWRGKTDFELHEFRDWAKDLMPNYQVPSVVKVLSDNLPRNSMGKVNKKQLIKELFDSKS